MANEGRGKVLRSEIKETIIFQNLFNPHDILLSLF